MPDSSAIQFESKRLRGLTAAECRCLRALTSGDKDSHLLAVLRERPDHARCFLARAGEEIVGWALARWFAPFEEAPRNAHISVFVNPAWRRQGLGQELVEQAAQFARTHRLTAWVYAGNAEQRAFYQTCGHPVKVTSTPFQSH